MTGQRVYAMTKIGPGDYLLPSNDATTLFRIYTYQEDGSAEFVARPGAKPKPLVGTFWAIARRPFPNLDADPSELLSWGGGWEFAGGPYRTRAQAIEAAL